MNDAFADGTKYIRSSLEVPPNIWQNIDPDHIQGVNIEKRRCLYGGDREHQDVPVIPVDSTLPPSRV